MNLHSYFIHLHFILKLHSILASKTNSLHTHTVSRAHRYSPTSCFIWKFCTRLRSVNIRIVHSAVSRSDSSKSLKLKSVILRVWADGTTAALGKGRGRNEVKLLIRAAQMQFPCFAFRNGTLDLAFSF